MKNFSLTLFNNSELITLLILCTVFCTFIFLVFHFLKLHSKTDLRNLLLITGCYAIISLWHLGSTVFPTTTWQPSEQKQEIIFHLTKNTEFNAIYTIYGEGDNNANPDNYQLGTEGIELYGSNDSVTWEPITTLQKGSIYQYQITEGSWNYSYIRLVATNINCSLTEIGFRNTTNSFFLPIEVTQDAFQHTSYPATLLIDEQEKLVLNPTYENESYFDEIYHVRNAWEIANGQDMYASVHPLLGTNIIALFIKLFGMSPFVWRLPGAIFGILLVPLLYAITKKLFSSTAVSTISAILLSADFMHLTTSRIATLEPFSVFWILLMYYFMISYIKLDWKHTTFKKQILYLAYCGITMGIAIATKWTACYSAVGLAILLFAHFFKEFKQRKENPFFTSYLIKTILLCFVFFIFIPIIIYVISYLPDHVWKGDSWSIQNVWKQCLYMYNYHANLNATHPYSSTWQQWLMDARPIWYYNGYDQNQFQHTISCFSNPLMTWTALGTIIFTFIDGIRTKSQNAFIICIGYITALAPWMIITRCVFAYHFYPTSFFAILSIAYIFQYLWKDGKIGKTVTVIFLIVYIVLFLAFLPVTAGFSTTNTFIKSIEWFSTWYFG